MGLFSPHSHWKICLATVQFFSCASACFSVYPQGRFSYPLFTLMYSLKSFAQYVSPSLSQQILPPLWFHLIPNCISICISTPHPLTAIVKSLRLPLPTPSLPSLSLKLQDTESFSSCFWLLSFYCNAFHRCNPTVEELSVVSKNFPSYGTATPSYCQSSSGLGQNYS